MAASKVHKVPTELSGTELGAWLLTAEGAQFCERFGDLNRRYWQLPISVAWQAERGLYRVSDVAGTRQRHAATSDISIARRARIFRYRRGVHDRIARLAAKYFLDRIDFAAGDIAIDCGANVGEVGLYLRSRAKVRVIAVEPSQREACACDENLFGGRPETLRLALWHSAGSHKFYDGNDTGDSSLIEPANAAAPPCQIQTTTLAALVDAHADGPIKLLKIEGEGAEPEILAGGREMLETIVHCCVDCGPERGLSQDHVIAPVCNQLFAAGFELVDVNLERQIFWFRNPALA